MSEKSISLLQPVHRDIVYELDAERMLRPELTAQIRHGLDDVRKLWQPPYVPG